MKKDQKFIRKIGKIHETDITQKKEGKWLSKYIKGCSTSFIKIKTTAKYHFACIMFGKNLNI